MEESSKKMEEAEKRGDQRGQMAAASEALGTLLAGGKRVDPVGADLLKPFLPETFAGLSRKSSSAEKTGMAGLMISRAEATYGDDRAKRVTVEVTDTGGASGLAGFASWIGIQGEKEDENGVERTERVDGRIIHEKTAKGDGTNEFGMLLGERFVVNAEGNGVSLSDLKAAVSAMPLSKLESMKDLGVQK